MTKAKTTKTKTPKVDPPWSMQVEPDVKRRRGALTIALGAELARRGLKGDAMPQIHLSSTHWSTRTPTKILVSVGFYPDTTKTFREPKHGFNIQLIVDAAVLAWERREERKRVAEEEKRALDANYDAMRRIQED